MSNSNPYQSPLTKPGSGAWRPVDFIVAGIWIAIPIGVFVGRRMLFPVFEEYGIELPVVAQYLFGPYAPLPFAFVSLIVVVLVCCLPAGKMRRGFMWMACILGVLLGVLCSVVMLLPLLSLWQNLS